MVGSENYLINKCRLVVLGCFLNEMSSSSTSSTATPPFTEPSEAAETKVTESKSVCPPPTPITPSTHALSARGFPIPPHKYILAPMVGGSELAFRMLCRQYNTTLCYTPMFESVKFVQDPAYRADQFTTCPSDRPLAVQFCGNNPETLLKAAQLVQHQCDAVDLNLGCPQRSARSGHYGSFLTDKKDRALVREGAG